MSINLNSRYASGHVERYYPDPRREAELKRSLYVGPRRPSTPVVLRDSKVMYPVDSVYIWVSGDRWDTVAAKLGIPKTEWWKILDANPQIEFPTAIRPGMFINVPVVSVRII